MSRAKAPKNFFVEGVFDEFSGKRRKKWGPAGVDAGFRLDVMLLRDGKPHSPVSIEGRALDGGKLLLVVKVEGNSPVHILGDRGTPKQRYWRAKRPQPTGLGDS